MNMTKILHSRFLSAMALSVCVLAVSCLRTQGLRADGEGLSVCLGTDRAVYSPSDALHMTLRVSNLTEETVTLEFRDAQRFDFAIEEDGQVLWRWSQGRVFAQMLGSVALTPGDSLTFRKTYEGGLKPGTYRVTGTVTARGMPLGAYSTITVGP